MRALATVLWSFLNLWLAIAAFQLDLTTNGFVAYCIFLVMLFIAVIFHEAGHALVARRVGARVLTFAALIFEYDFANRKFGWMRRKFGRELGGFVIYSWPLGAGTHRKEVAIAAAGPLANFVTAALAVALVPAFAPPAPSSPAMQIEPQAFASADTPDRREAPAASLPDPATAALAYDRYRNENREPTFRHFIEAALQVFALLSVGIAVINLVQFDGSDGAKLRDQWRSTRRRGKR